MPGQDILIFGLGTIGLLAVKIAHLMGAGRIIAVNRSHNERRFQIAREFGAGGGEQQGDAERGDNTGLEHG